MSIIEQHPVANVRLALGGQRHCYLSLYVVGRLGSALHAPVRTPSPASNADGPILPPHPTIGEIRSMPIVEQSKPPPHQFS